jgi:acyl dehydratase
MVISKNFIKKDFGETYYEIAKEKIKEFLLATKADLEKFKNGISPPTFCAVFQSELLSRLLFDQEINLNLKKLVHGEQEFIYHKHPYVGDLVKSRGFIEDIFEKKGHDFLIFKVLSFNSQEELLIEAKWTFVIRGGNHKDFNLFDKLSISLLNFFSRKANSPKLKLKTNPYYEALTDNQIIMRVLIEKYMPQKYAGASGDFNPIHLDNDLGKKVGLGGLILHGMASMALAGNLAIKIKDVEDLKSFKVRFSAPVKPLDLLTFIISYSKDLKSAEIKAINYSDVEVLSSCSLIFS